MTLGRLPFLFATQVAPSPDSFLIRPSRRAQREGELCRGLLACSKTRRLAHWPEYSSAISLTRLLLYNRGHWSFEFRQQAAEVCFG